MFFCTEMTFKQIQATMCRKEMIFKQQYFVATIMLGDHESLCRNRPGLLLMNGLEHIH